MLAGAPRAHLGEGPVARRDAHARRRGRDRRVVVQDAEGERLEHDGLGERPLDGEDRRPRKVQLALAVSRDGAGEAVALEEREGGGIHDPLVAEEAQLVVAEAEVPDEPEQAPGACDDPEPPATRQTPAEQLEHATTMGGAVAQGGVEHGELVPVGVQGGAARGAAVPGGAHAVSLVTRVRRVGWTIVDDAPIGIFDSGVGGLTVARAVSAQLPRESILYIGDTARSPYGPKPIADVRRYSLEILDTLVEQGVKMLVIACNTASAAMLRDARERYDVPVVEVIGPAVRTAMSTTRNGRIGVIGTAGTIGSGAYQDMLEVNERLTVFAEACPRFVEFVEAGVTDSPEVLAVAEQYLAPLRHAGVDTLVLGCTHYPFLEGAISYVMGPDVSLVSSDTETAKDVYRQLVSRDLLAGPDAVPTHVYEATGASADEFLRLAHRLMGREVREVQLVQTGAIDLPLRGSR